MERPAITAPASAPTVAPERAVRTLRRYNEELVDQAIARYLEGESGPKVAGELRMPVSSFYYQLRRRGIERRPSSVPHKHPAPEERTCALAGCDVRFTPTGYSISRGWGKFCSPEHGYIARRVAEPRERPCLYCGHLFTPWPHEVDREFCDPSHRQLYNWRAGRSGARGLVEWWRDSEINGRARQRHLGAWEGEKYGRLGGRPAVRLTDEQLVEAERLKEQGWGRRAIASRLLVSERAVRNALAP